MRDEVPHEDIEHVIVRRHVLARTRHAGSLVAILIIGQDFLVASFESLLTN